MRSLAHLALALMPRTLVVATALVCSVPLAAQDRHRQHLIKKLTAGDAAQRADAASFLSVWKDKEVADALIRATSDKAATVRENALLSLCRFPVKLRLPANKVIPRLLLDEEENVSTMALILASKNDATSPEVLVALGRLLGGARASWDHRLFCARMIVGMSHGKAKDGARLMALRGDAIAHIQTTAKSEDPRKRMQALFQIQRLYVQRGGFAAIPAQLLALAESGLSDSAVSVRAAAGAILMPRKAGSAQAARAIEQALRPESGKRLRIQVLDMIAGIGNQKIKEQLRPLIQRTSRDADKDVAIAASDLLERLQETKAKKSARRPKGP